MKSNLLLLMVFILCGCDIHSQPKGAQKVQHTNDTLFFPGVVNCSILPGNHDTTYFDTVCVIYFDNDSILFNFQNVSIYNNIKMFNHAASAFVLNDMGIYEYKTPESYDIKNQLIFDYNDHDSLSFQEMSTIQRGSSVKVNFKGSLNHSIKYRDWNPNQ